jgi:ATP-dependent DNA ligase
MLLVIFIAFDLLYRDGEDLYLRPPAERERRLDDLGLNGRRG